MAVEIGDDGRCKCSAADPCPLGRTGSEIRCSAEELERAGFKPLYPKMKLSEGVWAVLRKFFAPDFEVSQILPELVSMVRDRLPRLLEAYEALVKREFHLNARCVGFVEGLEKIQKALDPEGEEELAPVEEMARRIRMRLEDTEEERTRLDGQIREMIQLAVDEKLDGYRELGQRAADAENQRDRVVAALKTLGEAAMSVRRENQIEWLVWFEQEIHKADGVLGTEPVPLPGLKEVKVPYCIYCGSQHDLVALEPATLVLNPGKSKYVCEECGAKKLLEKPESEG